MNRIKACTCLPYANESDWTNAGVVSAVEEFVSTTDRKILCLFYENDTLKTTFCVPDARTDSIMWFLKTADKECARLDASNFLKLVSFGKMDTQVEKTMFLLLDSLYSPFIFSWSASILLNVVALYNCVWSIPVCCTRRAQVTFFLTHVCQVKKINFSNSTEPSYKNYVRWGISSLECPVFTFQQ